MNGPDLNSPRARLARLGKQIGKTGYNGLVITGLLFASGSGLGFAFVSQRFGYLVAALALFVFMLAVWYKEYLSKIPLAGNGLTGRLSGELLAILPYNETLNPQVVWQSLSNHWQLLFITNHLFISPSNIEPYLSVQEAEMGDIWQRALQLADASGLSQIEVGHIAIAILLGSPIVMKMFQQFKLTEQDIRSVATWLERGIEAMNLEKPYFGGIGRDWAMGFTPELDRFGHNISQSIERHGAHFGWLTDSPGVTTLKNSYAQGATSVALIGEEGVGKTSHIYALAQLLLEEEAIPHLAHHQIVSLSPSQIISAAARPGDLENILNVLMNEALHAGNIVIFFDDAELFFKSGPGSFDATQILLPVLQSRAIQLIFAMTPHDYQSLKSSSPAFAGQLTPVTITEPSEDDVMHILEDTAMGLEHQHHLLITYEALREAYRLSGRYEQDGAYPGKAIKLLEQALAHGEHDTITDKSVQRAIEQSKGVKVSDAAPAEADQLLNLEGKIHERMINQTRAVSVVASALRRARAGVTNPKRPLGSFLFLGPTGVGKTELAKAVAATYFGSESQMIRLDMSEYQQPGDIDRILSDGRTEQSSLIMSVRQQPFSVVLLDEIEKAHPNILNLLLQMLDEGQLTDVSGRTASFKDCVIIATSNAGAVEIRERVERGETLDSFESQLTDQLINSGQFKPELLNRFDEIVLFRPLTQEELAQVVHLMLNEVNSTLSPQNISVSLTDTAVAKIVATGYDARLGARPMRRALQRAVEDSIAKKILAGQIHPGDHVQMDATDLEV